MELCASFFALLLQIHIPLPQITDSSSPPFSLPLKTERRVYNNSNQLNRSRNLEQYTVNRPHSPVTTSANHFHVQPTHDPVMTAINHSSPTRKHRRRRKRKSTTNRYWRRDNHKIQLDTNAVINLSTVTLTHVETQLHAAVSPFVVLHVTLTGLKLELISMNLADV